MSDLEAKLKALGLYRHGNVGKRVGNEKWVHIDYFDLCFDGKTLSDYEYLINQHDLSPVVVRLNLKTNDIAFIESPDFNSAHEPRIGRSLLIRSNGGVRLTNPSKNPFIYHHKWMFVPDDHPGFSVIESKARSVWWKEKLGRDRSLSSRIGRYEFWTDWLSNHEEYES